MNSNPHSLQTLVCPVLWALACTCFRLRRSPKRSVQLLGLLVGLLFLIGSSGQAFSQAPAPSLPVEWVSLVASLDDNPPVNNEPLSHSIDLDHSSSLSLKSPLANLRQSDPSGLLSEDHAAAQIAGNSSYSNRQNRGRETLAVGWSQPELRHRRLYFEDQQIERGNDQRRFPNIAAGANFVKSLVAFPVRLVTGN